MPCLNSDILFDIGKILVKNGDSDAVARFVLSGREPLKAIKKVFSAVTNLELYWNSYAIGWNKEYTIFNFNNNNIHLKPLLFGIGEDVKHFLIDYYDPGCQPIIDIIIAKKQLISFSVGSYRNVSFLNIFFLELSSSLKTVTIPSYCMTPTFRDSLNLNSLIILDVMGDNFALFCCKTPSLIFSRNRHSSIPFLFKDMYPKYGKISSHISTVKHITINYININFIAVEFEEMMKHYTSLEIIKFKFLMDDIEVKLDDHIPFIVTSVNKLINEIKIFPPKIIFIFLKSNITITFHKLLNHMILGGFEFNGLNPYYYCYKKLIPPTANGTKEESKVVEIKLAK